MTSLALRLLAGALLGAGLLSAAAADDRPALRGDVVAKRDVLTLGDLVAGAPPALAETALFRAPGLGQTGTVQAHRIVEAASGLGVAGVETGGRLQVTVSRAARVVGPGEIEAVLRRALEREGLDARSTGVTFDGAPPSLVAAPDLSGEANVGDLLYDRRSRRLTAMIWLGPSSAERRASLAVSGTAVETVEVAVLSRALDRGDAIKSADVAIERRPRDSVAPDTAWDGQPVDGRVARRPLGSGTTLRTADLMRPELVARNDTVNLVYEVPGISLSLRVRATESGALGDTITVVNPGTKKAVLAKVTGPGRVSIAPAEPARVVASAAATARP